MQRRKYVLDQVLSLSQTKIDIPTRNIIDAIILTVEATYSNSSGSDVTITDEDLAKAIQEIRVVSDGAVVHYALSLSDLLIINYYDTAGKVPRLDSLNTIPASGTLTKRFTIRLDGGDIVAAIKQSLSISILTNKTISSEVSLQDLKIIPTIDEIVLEDVSELTELYGENLEEVIEPKVTAIETNVYPNTSFTGIVEMPTGNAILRSFYIAKNNTGARSDTIIDQYGMVDRNSTILYKVPWATGQDLDRQEYNIDNIIKGVTILDYAEEMAEGESEIFDEEFGVKGWNYVQGDYYDAFKINETGKIRIIRHELILTDELKEIIDSGEDVDIDWEIDDEDLVDEEEF